MTPREGAEKGGFLSQATGWFGDHTVKLRHGFVAKYDTGRLSTARAFCTFSGTVLGNRTLWVDELVIMTIFTVVTAVMALWHPRGFLPWAQQSEAKSRSFVVALQTLAAFLLSFYVSLSVNRWWSIRTDGVGKIVHAVHQLQAFMSAFVTRDEAILDAVRRYARASLLLLYQDRQNESSEAKWQRLEEKKVLRPDEKQMLQLWHNPEQCLWSWIGEIIAREFKKGAMSDSQSQFLMSLCSKGLEGVQYVQTQLTTQIPLTYVHLLCMLVIIHNFFLAVMMGTIAAYYAIHGESWFLEADVAQLGFRVFLSSFFYNALLCIAVELEDPLSGDATDFDVLDIQHNIEKTGSALASAGAGLPPWLAQKLPPPPV